MNDQNAFVFQTLGGTKGLERLKRQVTEYLNRGKVKEITSIDAWPVEDDIIVVVNFHEAEEKCENRFEVEIDFYCQNDGWFTDPAAARKIVEMEGQTLGIVIKQIA